MKNKFLYKTITKICIFKKVYMLGRKFGISLRGVNLFLPDDGEGKKLCCVI